MTPTRELLAAVRSWLLWPTWGPGAAERLRRIEAYLTRRIKRDE